METLRIVEMYSDELSQWVVIPMSAVKEGMFIRMWDPDGTPVLCGTQDEFHATCDAYENRNGVLCFEFMKEEE